MSNTARRVGPTPNKCAKMQCSPVGFHSCFEMLDGLDDCTHSHSTLIKGKTTYIGHFHTLLILQSGACERSVYAATTAWTPPPHAGHILQWDGFLFLNQELFT